jgi:hypothetical protein
MKFSSEISTFPLNRCKFRLLSGYRKEISTLLSIVFLSKVLENDLLVLLIIKAGTLKE